MGGRIFSHLLLLFTLATSLVHVRARTHPADAAALAALKQAVDPTSITPGSCLSSWDFAADPCDSAFGERFTCGFRCDDTDSATGLSRVTELSLDSAGYSGELSPAVWSLTALQSLDLADNSFSGAIPAPPPAGVPSKLRRITLSRNFFSGEIPLLAPALSLEELYLDNNQLTGEIPSSLTELRSLKRLELQANNFTDGLPDLSNLISLYYLDASDSGISGSFPSTLPSSLLEVILRNDKLNGPLSGEAVAALSTLQVLDLNGNYFSGSVPAAVFQHPALEQLSLANNKFDAVAPPRDGGASSQLIALNLGHNMLTGLLPSFLGAMPKLTALTLEYNKFTGMIPMAYAVRTAGTSSGVGAGAGAVPFQRLLLAGNYLFGPVPSVWGELGEGSAVVSLADNCLYRCPPELFVCKGAQQKPSATCREFNPVIP